MVRRYLGEVSPSSLTLMIVLLLALNLRHAVDAENFCPDEASVDLTNAKRNATGLFAESGQFFPTGLVLKTNDVLLGCMCDIRPCVLRCFPRKKEILMEISRSGYSGNISMEIPPAYTTNLTLEDDGYSPRPKDRLHVFAGDPCMGGPMYSLRPEVSESDEWYLLKNGSLFLPRQNGTNAFIDWRLFCFRKERNRTVYTPRVCFPKPESDPVKATIYIAGLVSAPFLIATIFVYSVLPELRNVHGNTFRCYMCCLLVAHITLAIDRIPPPDFTASVACLVLGFVIYFSFLTSFLWLNVMCFDMWWRFGGYGSLRNGGKLHDRKKFIGYSICAWGIGAAITVICISLEFLSDSFSESILAPGFRRRACWFGTKGAEALYFFGPVGVTIICNICLFVSTSVKLIQTKKSTQHQLSSDDSKRHHENKLLFSLYLKLFVVMGISWSTEVISGLWDAPRNVWYVTDTVNALHGVLIFIIFICKKKIWKSLRKRFNFSSQSNFTQRGTDSKTTTSSLDDSAPGPNRSIALNARTNKDTSTETSPDSFKAPG